MRIRGRQLAVGFIASIWALACATTAQAQTIHYDLTGLAADAEIVVDNYGVPHIYAQTHYDAFFVQGFNAARDRLWQIDTWRRRGLGKLAEAFGPAYTDQDRAARLFLFRDDMYHEWLAYSSDAKKIAESFTNGINAYVDLLATHPELMPPEFGILDYQPSKWEAADVVRIRSHGLWRNLVSEVQRARLHCAGKANLDVYRKVLEPAWQTQVPAGLDPCSIPADVLDDYLLATAKVDFDNPQLTLANARSKALRPARAQQLGSNNWAIAPAKTTTGRAILADDPHRAHAVPSLRYIAHLSAPGLDVIGAGEPSLPGISIGHNNNIAFGLTIFPLDHEDLYVYELARDPLAAAAPETPFTGYIYKGQYERFIEVTETINVRGAAAVSITLHFTRHGPVLQRNQDSGLAFAVRAAWLEVGMAPYFGSVEYMRAQNWREFVAALNRWGAPSENQVFADTAGNIGYKPAGLFPRRDNFDGLLPVPGDGRYEWNGYWDMDVLPEEYNPERGWVATANAMSLPQDYDIATYRVGFEWSAPWRYLRLKEVLSQPGKLSLANSLSLQRDYNSVLAKRILARLPPLLPRDSSEPHAAALRYLARWQGRLNPGSGPAAFYAIWLYRHLNPQLAASVSTPAGERSAADAADLALPSIDSLALLEAMGSAPTVVAVSLATAWQDATRLLGDTPADWSWGTLHKIEFEHPLLNRMSAEQRQIFALPSYPRGGSGNTTNNTYFHPEDFKVRSGASFRMVLDVGNWDKAFMTNAPGQSGDPRSPFYANLLDGWAKDGSFPLLYSRYQIEKNAALRIKLTAVSDSARLD